MSTKKKILVVDDSASVRQHVGNVLVGAGYEVIEAADGVLGGQEIDRSRDLAMVICDVNMPNLNGIDMVTQVKADERNAALPIIMLTTEGQPALVERAKKAGARGWIVKPFKNELLIAAVRKLVGN
jgi:two-component system, chemotaxis family, chemotaxis protein CheY